MTIVSSLSRLLCSLSKLSVNEELCTLGMFAGDLEDVEFEVALAKDVSSLHI
jgi:hypothetical protein